MLVMAKSLQFAVEQYMVDTREGGDNGNEVYCGGDAGSTLQRAQ